MSLEKIKKTLKNNNYKGFDTTNLEQIETLNHILDGDNVFITGAGGVGKSYFISKLCDYFNAYGINYNIVTPTGISALNLNSNLKIPVATTYHSYYGFRPNSQDFSLKSLALNRIKTTQVLIIDEISMIASFQLDRMSRKHSKPEKDTSSIFKIKSMFSANTNYDMMFDDFFEGTQVIMIGDLFQLPPVIKNNNVDDYPSTYFFGSYALKNSKKPLIKKVFLKNYRVESSKTAQDRVKIDLFKNLLTSIRYNCLDDFYKKILSDINNRKVINEDKVIAAINKNYLFLSPVNRQCEHYNDVIKKTINKPYINISANPSPTVKRTALKYSTLKTYLKNMFGLEAELKLKIGQKIIFTSNDNSDRKSYKNGQLGKIKSFVIVNGEVKSIVVKTEFGNVEVDKIIYSKPTYAESEKLKQVTLKLMKDKNFTLETKARAVKNTVSKWVEQFPIKDGYAITIHKSQGLTSEKTVINPDVFENGQLYVAISRSTNMDTLYFTEPIKPKHIKTDIEVLKYYYDNDLIENEMKPLVIKKLDNHKVS